MKTYAVVDWEGMALHLYDDKNREEAIKEFRDTVIALPIGNIHLVECDVTLDTKKNLLVYDSMSDDKLVTTDKKLNLLVESILQDIDKAEAAEKEEEIEA